jgi:peptidoglycan/LPS O-acetylase OafA/YrhL
MKKYFSCYLDLIRFISALLVVLDHYVQYVVGESTAHLLPAMGREAVVLFFVLSGFVIAYATETKTQTIKQYAIARASRIYSVALPLLFLAFLAVFIIEKSTGKPVPFDYQIAKAYVYLPFHILFMGELWTFSERPLWLDAYWSLNFEVWYYVFFATVFFFRGNKRLLLSGTVLLILGYKLWLLLPVWYSGVLLWRMRDKVQINKTIARAGWACSIVCLCVYKYFGWDEYLRLLGMHIWPFPQLPLGSAERFLCDYAVCAIVFLNFYCANQAEFFALEKFSTLVKNIASYTFTLYLVHLLVISIWLQFFSNSHTDLSNVLLLSLSIAAATYLTGQVTEHRRRWFAGRLTIACDFVGRVVQRAVRVFRIAG